MVARHSPAKPDSESIPNLIALHPHSVRHHAHSVTESFAQSDRIAGGYGDTHSNGNSQSKRDANSNGNAHTQCLADASRVVRLQHACGESARRNSDQLNLQTPLKPTSG